MLLVDLVFVVSIATVTDQSCTSDFLFEHEAHLGLEPSNEIELINVENIITIELLLLVNGLRGRDTPRNLEELLLLQSSLDVTLGTSLFEREVRPVSLDPSKRALANRAQEWSDPLGVALVPFGSCTVDGDRIREQRLDVGDTMLQVLFRPYLEGRLECLAGTLGVLHDFFHRIMRENRGVAVLVLQLAFENVV